MRILVLGGLSERGLKFIETLPIRDYLIVVDDLKNNKDKNLMKLLIQRKFKFYKGDSRNLIKIINDAGGVDEIHDYTA